MFERTTAQATTYARINLNYTASIAMDNGYRLQQGTYKRESGVRTLLLPGTSPAVTLYTFDATVTPRAVQINYTFISNSGNFVRTGTYTIVSGTTSSGLGLVGSDQSVDNDSNSGIGLTLSVTESSDIVSWKYVTAGGVGGYLYYSVTSLA
jgi:hypothetical protein